jgi:hypothetical protein
LLPRKIPVTMALDAQHRSSLYQKFVPLLGDDDANALMSEFPAREADELVTKQFLRAELAEVELRLTGLIGEVDHRLTTQFTEVDQRLSGQIAQVDHRLVREIHRVDERAAERTTSLEERLTARYSRHTGYLIAVIGVATAFLRLT